MKLIVSALAALVCAFTASNAIAEDNVLFGDYLILDGSEGTTQTIINPIQITDYSYRNLEGFYFQNESLAEYNFSNANLRGAHFINVTDIGQANFTGADLSGALWVDGRICAEGSIGECK